MSNSEGYNCITDNDKYPKYKGVRLRKWGKWVSEVRLPNSRERIWLGSFDTPEKAARAFDAAQFCLRGRCARFNFPDDPPRIPGGESLSPQEIQVVAARFANEISSSSNSSIDHHQQEEEEDNVDHHSMVNYSATNEDSSFSSQQQMSQNPNYYDQCQPYCYGNNDSSGNADAQVGGRDMVTNSVSDWSLFLNMSDQECGSANNYDSFESDLFYDNQMHYSGHEFFNPAVPALQDSDSAREDQFYSAQINGDESISHQQYSSFLWNF